MRKYKFRAWDKKKKKMLYLSPNDTILFQNGKCTVWKENQYDETEECFCCETFSDVIPMLYSGYKDKNGKEIYEGDVLLNTYKPMLKNIFSDRQVYVIEYQYKGFRFKPLFKELACKYEIEEDMKVIGNIYENPELLD